MLDIADILDGMKSWQPERNAKGGQWSLPSRISEDDKSRLLQELEDTLTRKPYVLRRSEIANFSMRNVSYFATDASNLRAAGIELFPDGSHRVLLCRPWTEEEKHLPIFAREMIALVETIQKRDSAGLWVIAVDNSTVVSAWRHKYSKAAFLRARLRDAKDHWDSVKVIQVRSEQNASDELSRDKDTIPDKVIMCGELLRNHLVMTGWIGPDMEQLTELVS
jgi:hypothetical protein